MRVVQVDAATVRPLRHAVLRAGRPAAESVYPQDDLADTVHLAAVDPDGTVVACGTFFPEALGGEPAWRLRGMATASGVRRQGHAGSLLAEALRLLDGRGVTTLWCNARTAALPFYRRWGFTVLGEEFESAGVPHYRAVLSLTGTRNGTPT
jgi:predicted GNAT family N-acyltransferase